MLAHIQGMPTPIRVAYKDLAIPDVLTESAMYCLQKDREKRPASARELIRIIELVEKEIHTAAKAKSATRKTPGITQGIGLEILVGLELVQTWNFRFQITPR
jgi:hypothetical protein